MPINRTKSTEHFQYFFQRSNKECLNDSCQVHHTTFGTIQRVVCNRQQSMVSARKQQEFSNHSMLKRYQHNRCVWHIINRPETSLTIETIIPGLCLYCGTKIVHSYWRSSQKRRMAGINNVAQHFPYESDHIVNMYLPAIITYICANSK